MKAVILAGGLGTRLSEETHIRPKPMVEIGGNPILWHILKIYSYFGINEFIICCGYKGYQIKDYFANYFLHTSDITFHMREDNRVEIHQCKNESWKVTLIDTGEQTNTGGRLLRVKDYLDTDDFCFTYGDGLADINIKRLIRFHKSHQLQATLTAVTPPGRFGAIHLEDDFVKCFKEKTDGQNSRINGGFFVLNPSVLERIQNDQTSWEYDVLPEMASEGELKAFLHDGFWQPMDTLRDKRKLEELWGQNKAPWKLWV